MLSRRAFPLLAIRPNTDGPADNLPLSIDRSSSRPYLLAYVFLAHVFLDTFHVRQRPVGATRAFRFFLSRTTSSPRLLSSYARRTFSPPFFASFLFPLVPFSPPVRNSDSFQGNVYPRRKMRLKCIGACFPRRARAISTHILWVYHMTAPYLGIHAYRCKDFGKREISLRHSSQMFSVKF